MYLSSIRTRRFVSENFHALILGAFLFLLIAAQSGLLYVRSRDAMEQQLKLRLQSAASIGALQFTGEELDRIHGKRDANTMLYKDIVRRLNDIRSATPNIEYAYIMRRTEDPMVLQFVADADTFLTLPEADINGNGIMDPDEKGSEPGDLYPIEEIPALQGEAFERPTTDEEITVDQWGELISGYAPLYRRDGTVAGVIGLDMDASEFIALSHKAFSLLGLLTFLSIGVVVAMSTGYITWQRRVTAMRMVENERSSMLALTTHQMGGPITAIRWWIEMMQDKGVCDRTRACEQITVAVRKLNDIMVALIATEQKEKGKIAYESRQSNVRSLVGTAVSESVAKTEKQHEVRVDIAGDLTVNLDPKLIHGVLTELLENAMTYSKQGTLVEVSAVKHGGHVLISIRDFGCGIPQNELPHIFDKLRRGKEAYLYKPDGNGLGLYTAKLIVERAGGSIDVVSAVGKGSTFTVRLPVS